jgi:hypothetical protein
MKNRDTQQLKKIDDRTKFQHFQHSQKFNKELNAPNQNITTPFRIIDNIWLFGKYKGHKLETIPATYLSWVLQNFNNLSKTHKALIQQKIENI